MSDDGGNGVDDSGLVVPNTYTYSLQVPVLNTLHTETYSVLIVIPQGRCDYYFHFVHMEADVTTIVRGGGGHL